MELIINSNDIFENDEVIYTPIIQVLKNISIDKSMINIKLLEDYKKQKNKIKGLLVYKKSNSWSWIE